MLIWTGSFGLRYHTRHLLSKPVEGVEKDSASTTGFGLNALEKIVIIIKNYINS